MSRKKQEPIWSPDVCDFMAKLCDVLELPDDLRIKWVADTRATIAAAERDRKQPKLKLIAGGKSG